MGHDDGYKPEFGSDAADVKSRLKAWMRTHKISTAWLEENGISVRELHRFFDCDFDELGRDAALLQRFCAITGCDYGYLISGSLPSSVGAVERERLRLYELAERFCEGLGLHHSETTAFVSAIMQRFMPRLSTSEFAMFQTGVPVTIEDIEVLYKVWKQDGRLE